MRIHIKFEKNELFGHKMNQLVIGNLNTISFFSIFVKLNTDKHLLFYSDAVIKPLAVSIKEKQGLVSLSKQDERREAIGQLSPHLFTHIGGGTKASPSMNLLADWPVVNMA